MRQIARLIRRTIIHAQLRCLDRQAESIMEAREHALIRLIQIRRERDIKMAELAHCDSPGPAKAAPCQGPHQFRA